MQSGHHMGDSHSKDKIVPIPDAARRDDKALYTVTISLLLVKLPTFSSNFALKWNQAAAELHQHAEPEQLVFTGLFLNKLKGLNRVHVQIYVFAFINDSDSKNKSHEVKKLCAEVLTGARKPYHILG